MDEYFTNNPQDNTNPSQDPPTLLFTPAPPTITHPPLDYEFTYAQQPAGVGAGEEEFNDFEEDEAARRIRQEEERIQGTLREKSDREWEEKEGRKREGRRQLEEFATRKAEEREERAKENVRREGVSKEELGRLNVEAGWRKVISNINVRSGEHKGKKEIGRMREAVLHRREDDKR